MGLATVVHTITSCARPNCNMAVFSGYAKRMAQEYLRQGNVFCEYHIAGYNDGSRTSELVCCFFRLANLFLSFPDDFYHGKIVESDGCPENRAFCTVYVNTYDCISGNAVLFTSKCMGKYWCWW